MLSVNFQSLNSSTLSPSPKPSPPSFPQHSANLPAKTHPSGSPSTAMHHSRSPLIVGRQLFDHPKKAYKSHFGLHTASSTPSSIFHFPSPLIPLLPQSFHFVLWLLFFFHFLFFKRSFLLFLFYLPLFIFFISLVFVFLRIFFLCIQFPLCALLFFLFLNSLCLNSAHTNVTFVDF